jgi:hypothetical protein
MHNTIERSGGGACGKGGCAMRRCFMVLITIEGQLAEGDMVATRWTGRGTHQGELLGVPSSGNC